MVTTPSTLAGRIALLLSLGLPLVGSHLAQFSLHITDTVMLGWYSVEALAAAALGASAFFVLFIMGAGFSGAVMPLVAAAAATGDEVGARRLTRMGFWLSAVYAALVLPVTLGAEQLFLALGQSPALAEAGGSYLRIAGFGILPALVVAVLKSTLAALGRMQVILWTTIAAAFANALLNWVLIFGHFGAPELGLRGAAIASVAVQIVSLALVVVYFERDPALSSLSLFRRLWRPDVEAMARVFRLGWPIGLTQLAESGLFSASAFMMGWVGTRELAAHGIAVEITAATFMVHLGLSSAATIVTARADGQGDVRGLRGTAAAAALLSGGFAIVTMSVFVLTPEPLIRLFLDPADPEAASIVVIGAGLLAVAAAFQLADAAQVMALGLLRGLQDTRVPMLIAGLSYWAVGVPASYLLGFSLGLGARGIWYGLVLGLALAGGLLILRFLVTLARRG
ncbi:MAG: MATE family efflux transporter [Alphaproteobacteria bacterium]|nr:MAG: MATE family efflux transporter [Alphaproteobacteria bacterium]